ncbi:MAG: acetolactate synthase small subunit [Oscillospiraceae bacterium]|nr:acetolactate synthase small subunit [Oscillospiraceae bacterium]
METVSSAYTVELLVANRYGALNRITGIYARRGYNIDSLNMITDNPDVYRIIISSKGDEYARTQVVRQLSKLYDIKEVKLV